MIVKSACDSQDNKHAPLPSYCYLVNNFKDFFFLYFTFQKRGVHYIFGHAVYTKNMVVAKPTLPSFTAEKRKRLHVLTQYLIIRELHQEVEDLASSFPHTGQVWTFFFIIFQAQNSSTRSQVVNYLVSFPSLLLQLSHCSLYLIKEEGKEASAPLRARF